MAAGLKRNKPQKAGRYELDLDDTIHYDSPPEKRVKTRKHFPMKVKYESFLKDDYIDITNQIQNMPNEIDESDMED